VVVDRALGTGVREDLIAVERNFGEVLDLERSA